MNNILLWIKSNKVPTVLIIVLAFIAFGGIGASPISFNRFKGVPASPFSGNGGYYDEYQNKSLTVGDERMPIPGDFGSSIPRLDITDRMVVTNSYLSLLVKNVRESIEIASKQATKVGGYVVNSSISSPEGLSSGNITIRVPANNLETMLGFLRNSAVKVVTENINGDDITDQFVDTEERLKTLQTTKIKYEEILKNTNDVEQILIVTDRIIGIEQQIDDIKGQIEYMTQSSRSTLITVYMSTDELELPFAPESRWNAKLVFKYAVRSLVENARNMAGGLIWIAVYSIIWIPLIVVVWLIKKYWKKPQTLN
ncbi:DUF4349 domain-containing protein [candidate division WWE3 bacterium]|nr:DUF4349 domain-containing protein [candidate division WWE3 bacterium]